MSNPFAVEPEAEANPFAVEVPLTANPFAPSAPIIDFSQLTPAQRREHQRRLRMAQPPSALAEIASELGAVATGTGKAIAGMPKDLWQFATRDVLPAAGEALTFQPGPAMQRTAEGLVRGVIEPPIQYGSDVWHLITNPGMGDQERQERLARLGPEALMTVLNAAGARGAMAKMRRPAATAASVVAEPEAPGLALHDVAGKPIPGTEVAPGRAWEAGTQGVGAPRSPAPNPFAAEPPGAAVAVARPVAPAAAAPVEASVAAVSRVPTRPLPVLERPRATPEQTSAARVAASEIVNYERLMVPDGSMPTLDRWVTKGAEASRSLPRGVQTFEEAAAIADRHLAEPAALRAILAVPAERMSGIERLTVRRAMLQQLKTYTGLTKQLEDPTLAPSARQALADRLADADAQGVRLASKVVPSGTAQGRDLAFNRILADATMDPAVWLARAKQILGDAPLTDAVHTRIAGLVNSGDNAGLASYIAKLRTRTATSQLMTLFKVSLISAPTTLVKILSTNTTDAALLNAYRGAGLATALAWDRLLGIATGLETRTTIGSALTRAANLAARAGRKADIRGIWSGQPAARLRGGPFQMQPPDFTPLTELPAGAGALARGVRGVQVGLGTFASAISRLILNSHGTAHRLAWYPVYERAVAEMAQLQAKAEGLRGDALAARALEVFQNPTDEMQFRASDAAMRATLLNENVLGTAIQRGKAALRTAQVGGPIGPAVNIGARLAYAGAEMTVPFARITTNLLARGLESTPLGFAMSVPDLVRLFSRTGADLNRAAVQARLVERLARSTNGTLAGFTAGYLLAANQHAVGAGPETARGRQAASDVNQAPNSITILGHNISLLPFGPAGFAVAAGANVYEALHNEALEGPTAKAGAMAAATLRQASDESMLRGLAETGSAVHDPMRAGGGFLARQAAAWIPNVVAKVAQALAKQEMAPRGLAQTLASRIPGLAGTVPARLDAFGQPIARQRGALDIVADPFRATPEQADPILGELGRVGAHVPVPRRLPKETDAAYAARRARIGDLARQAAEAVIRDPEYRTTPESAARSLIEQAAQAGSEALRGRTASEIADALRQLLIEDAIKRATSTAIRAGRPPRGLRTLYTAEPQPTAAVVRDLLRAPL